MGSSIQVCVIASRSQQRVSSKNLLEISRQVGQPWKSCIGVQALSEGWCFTRGTTQKRGLFFLAKSVIDSSGSIQRLPSATSVADEWLHEHSYEPRDMPCEKGYGPRSSQFSGRPGLGGHQVASLCRATREDGHCSRFEGGDNSSVRASMRRTQIAYRLYMFRHICIVEHKLLSRDEIRRRLRKEPETQQSAGGQRPSRQTI